LTLSDTSLDSVPDTLRNAIGGDRLASSYLFYGRSPEEFESVLQTVMAGLVCREQPDPLQSCGACRDCRQIRALTHPDVTAPGAPGSSDDLDPDDRLGVGTVRERILEPASLTPARSPVKLFWLHDLNRFTPEASNTLLKVLEEPPGEAVFFLTSRSRWDCLPTIRSRCQWIRVAPKTESYEDFFKKCESEIDGNPDQDQLEDWLDLLRGESRSHHFNWSRSSTRDFLEFLLFLINDRYSPGTTDAPGADELEHRLSYRLIPDILQRLDELERGANPSLTVNSLLEELFYPEEQDEWVHVT
jgi:hypothetical protein